MNELSVKDCLRSGWESYKARPGIFVGAMLIIILVSVLAEIPGMFAEEGKPGYWAITIVATLFSIAISFLVSLGKTAFMLRAHDSVSSVRISDLWYPHGYVRFAGASVLSGLAIIIGLLLLIVPGIILGIMFSLSLYLVVERELGPVAALKESARLTKGNRWKLFLLGLAIMGINILGFLALVIGLLVTMPLSSLAVVHAYRVLAARDTRPALAAI